MSRLLTLVMLLIGAGALIGASQPEAPTAAQPQRFAYVDIMLDSAEAPLAAWQVELAVSEGVLIVGVEGGEHPAFAEPPYYDPKALLESERVVIGAFDTGDDLPTGETRIARVFVQLAAGAPTYDLTLTTAATIDGAAIDVDARVIEGSAE